jgi:hypothetical protein
MKNEDKNYEECKIKVRTITCRMKIRTMKNEEWRLELWEQLRLEIWRI